MLRIIMGWILLLVAMIRPVAGEHEEAVSFSVGEAASAEMTEEYVVYREGEKVEHLPLP